MHPEDRERLAEGFLGAASSMAFSTLADDIVGKVFFGP